MIAPKMVREFMLPYMRRIADFVKARGSAHSLDTDGDCRPLIPLFLEAGVTGMWPFEQTGGMDIWPSAGIPEAGNAGRHP